jgi:glycosyltransferase involved in cell wall biosynthesis
VNNLVGLGGLGLVGSLKLLKTPWVWQLGDSIPMELCSNENGLIPGLAKAFAREISGTYIVVSQRIHDVDSQGGLALNGRVELLPYWLTGERPPPRRRFFRPGEPLRMVYAGRVDPQKGADVLFEAAARLKAQGVQGFSIDLYGRVTDPTLQGYLLSLGIEDKVALKGPLPHQELLARYREYDLILFPTRRSEPFGLVPLEAAARGCVPVITDDCGVAEWLVHGIHCLKSTRRAEGFAKVIRRVIEGDVALEPIARRGAEAAWRDFHLDVILPKIEALLLEAAKQPCGNAGAATTGEAYRLARMAEHMTDLLVQDALIV